MKKMMMRKISFKSDFHSSSSVKPEPAAFLCLQFHNQPFSSTCILPAWSQILNYSADSPDAHISLIHYHGGAVTMAARHARSSQAPQPSNQTPHYLFMDTALG